MSNITITLPGAKIRDPKVGKYYKNYIAKCLSSKKIHERSEEVYYGTSHPFHNKLVNELKRLRGMVEDYKKSHAKAKPKQIVEMLRDEDKLGKLIAEEFNVEKCYIGWANAINACCFVQMFNKDVLGKGKSVKELRTKLDDIVITDNSGIRYKDKKGIYYAVVLGYPLFANDDILTVEESAGILMHELGHAIQQVVNSLNECTVISMYHDAWIKNLFGMANNSDKWILEISREVIGGNDPDEIDALGSEFAETLGKKDNKDLLRFSELDNDKINDAADKAFDSDWHRDYGKETKEIKEELDKQRKSKLFQFVANIFSAIFSVILYPLIFPIMLSNANVLKNKEAKRFRVFEETADNFAYIYGFGAELASALKKLDYDYSDVPLLINNIPMLDLLSSYAELEAAGMAVICGYPQGYQRITNIYEACEFELKVNKDLSAKDKEAILDTMKKIKTMYDEINDAESKKGWLYRKLCHISRESIEATAKKDEGVKYRVLIPLQMRADPNFNPDDALKK